MAFQFDREAAARARQAMLDGVSSDPGLQEASQAVLGEGERSGLWIPAQEKTESAKEETVRATLRRAEEPAGKAEAAEDWWTGGGSWRALERETLPETGEGTVPRPLHEAGTEGLPQEENNGRRNRHGRGRTVSEIPAEKPEREGRRFSSDEGEKTWQCDCGAINPNRIKTCSCGRSLYEVVANRLGQQEE